MLDMRFRHVAIGFAVGAGIGAGGAYAYLKRLQPPAVLQQLPNQGPKPTDEASVFRYHEAFKYGIPQTDMLRIFEGFVTSFDLRTKNPKWVLEYISKDTLYGDGTREQSWFVEDKGIEKRFRSKLEDFKESGYDRGHMAPAMNHRASQKAMDDTFTLSNISPQVGPGFNRDYWARFEKFIKDTVKISDGVFIVTGPLWLPQPDGLGTGKWEMKHAMIGSPPSLVSVPTHFFKVVLAENTSGKHGPHNAAVGAFVMPNAAIDPATPVTAFAVPLEALESVAGAKFFPGFLTDNRRAALDEAALQWQAEGKQQLNELSRVSLVQDQAVMLPPPSAAGNGKGSSSNGKGSSSSSSSTPVRASAPQPPQQPQQQQQQQPGGAALPSSSRRKTVNGDGATHLCDVVACQLPEPGWWDQGGGSSNGRGGGRTLNRSNSSRGRPRSTQTAAAPEAAPAGAAAEAVSAPTAAAAAAVPTAAAAAEAPTAAAAPASTQVS